MADNSPRLIVFSSLYPSRVRPNAGVFIRERMSKVAHHCLLVVISPVPWFPLQSLIQWFKPDYRPQPDIYEDQDGISVYFPRFLSIPGVGRSWDGFFMALCSLTICYRLKKRFAFNLIDAHFAYPDGYAATLLGKWFKVPVTITLRGTEVPLSKIPSRRQRLLKSLNDAARVFSVSDSLKRHVVNLGASAEKIRVVGNGIDTAKFFPIDRKQARQHWQIPEDAQVLISVGGLVDRKGFHRVIEILPALIEKFPRLLYLIVGGASPEGNIRSRLEQQVETLNLDQHVRFLGAMPAEQLHGPLSAADIFVLATANEGWANVFLEAMACGLPVISTDVGGNREVVADETLGTIVPFGDADALLLALDNALQRQWDRQAIVNYAADNSWDKRVGILLTEFKKLVES
ncbi:glycosyltransferase [Methylomonas denitrificans]|uniref:Glycosyl transferase family 1 n=3 Tax=Methylomonas TaxID=416 RepID=A0A126T2D5_9GAMM|nr:glycosyltransferase [Methylomonas denitrificans]AMK75874.1 glycosyl transferase family 1 [Methylomonas denitrificans]OAI01361.1 glycosyl transferase family 1 [Methylomonas methanica]TCV79250.1 glycosyltransferase involved in cell wall biosynthesis [Methylomonas methanica]